MFQARTVLNGHAGPIYKASWDGFFLYTTSGDKYVTRWDLIQGTQDSSFTVKLEHAAYTVAAADGYCLIACTDGTILAIDTVSKKLLWEHNFFGNAWFSTWVDSPRKRLIAGDSEGNLVVLDLSSGKRLLHLPLAAGKIRALSIVDDVCYVCTQLTGILVFSCETWNEIASWEPNELGTNVILVDPSANRIITGGRDAHLAISSMDFELLKRIPAHYQNIYGLIKIGDAFISASLDKTIKVWNSGLSEVKQRIEFKQGGHNRSVNGLVVINSDTFASYGDDKKIIVWEKGPMISWSEN